MREERGIFGGDHGALKGGGDSSQRDPGEFDVQRMALFLGLSPPGFHDRRFRGVMFGQMGDVRQRHQPIQRQCGCGETDQDGPPQKDPTEQAAS